MAVKATPVFAQTTRTAQAVCTAAKVIDATQTGTQLLLQAGVDGTIVTKLQAMPRATVTATQLQLYLSRDGGTSLSLVGSAAMGAYTLTQTTAAPTTDFGFSAEDPLRLGPDERLYVAIGVALAGGIVFHAEYADF